MESLFFKCITGLTVIIAVYLLTRRKKMKEAKTEIETENKTVVITGCDTGVGHELSKLLIKWKFKVISCCLDDTSAGATKLKELGAFVTNLNVVRDETIDDLARLIHQNFNGELYGLINNAGVMTYAPLEWQNPNHIKAHFEVNVSGMILVTKALLSFIKKTQGRIINISSVQSCFGSPKMVSYCASKAAVENFSDGLRRELSDFGVRVIIIRPCNLPLKTAILKRNAEQIQEMEASMDNKMKENCYDQITNTKSLFQTYFSNVKACDDLKDDRLRSAVWDAISSPSPQRLYTASNTSVRILLALLPVLPACVVDFIIKKEIHNAIIKRS